MQHEKIALMFEDFKSFLELKSKSIAYINQHTALPYYLNCHDQFESIEKVPSQDQLSLEELYILGLLIINNEPSTYKNIKAHLLKGLLQSALSSKIVCQRIY